MKFYATLFSLLLWSLSGKLFGQSDKRRLNLQQCIDEAWQNNLPLMQSRLQQNQSKVNYQQSVAQLFPSFSATVSATENYGRRIDPFTNQFATNWVTSGNGSLSTQLNVFSGFSAINNMKAQRLGYTSAQQNVEQAKNTVALQVATSFLQVILQQALNEVAANQLRITEEQLKRTKELVNAGRLAIVDQLQIEAQQANESFNVTRSANLADLAMLNLAQAMGLPNAESFAIDVPEPAKETPPFNAVRPSAIYLSALEWNPAVKSAYSNLSASGYLLKAAKGRYAPSIGFFAGLGTGYSGLARTPVGQTFVDQYIGDLNGQPIVLSIPTPIFTRSPFSSQVNDNINRFVGLSASIPIFNNFQVRSQVSQAQISLDLARINATNAEFQLRREIEQAWLDAKTAYEQYLASEKALNAQQTLFQNIRQRFDAGIANSLEFNQFKTQLAISEQNLLQARYDYIFKCKVLDFYQGKPITLP